MDSNFCNFLDIEIVFFYKATLPLLYNWRTGNCETNSKSFVLNFLFLHINSKFKKSFNKLQLSQLLENEGYFFQMRYLIIYLHDKLKIRTGNQKRIAKQRLLLSNVFLIIIVHDKDKNWGRKSKK